MKRWGNGLMLVSDSKNGREEPHWSERTGRGGALEELRYMMKGRGAGVGVMITSVHLGCKSVTIPTIQRGVKEPSSAKQESGRIWVFHCSYNRAAGGEERGQVPAQYWIWYIGFSCGWWESLEQRAGKGMSLSCRGVEDEEVLTRSSS